jgi:putative transposase
LAESFFATLECELINRRSWKTQAEARMALFIWIEGWYNPRRRHSALNYQSPITFERKHHHNTVGVEHGLPTASVGSSQATTDAVDNPAPVQSSA